MLTKSVVRLALSSLVILGACDDDDDLDDLDDIVDETPPIGGDLDRCFVRVDLVSSVAGTAERTDPTLINAWGLAPVDGAFAVVAAGADVLATYNADGSAAAIRIPNGLPLGAGYTGAAISTSTLLLSSEEGVISRITPTEPSRLSVVVDRRSSGAGYTGVANLQGLALGANFHQGAVDVFDPSFVEISRPAFVSTAVPAGYAPFNVAVLENVVYVAYALQDAATREEVTGAGLGYVAAFEINGTHLWTIGGAPFDAPWGMAIAPPSFGDLAGTLLVGNFGDGRITIVDRANQNILGQIADLDGIPVAAEGLWALATGEGVTGARTDSIYFTAGPADETQGVYGAIVPCE